MTTRLSKPNVPNGRNALIEDKSVWLEKRRAQSQLVEAERMSAIGWMACSISHDLRHSLTAIYPNAEYLERQDICASVRADLVLEIQEAVLEMTERLDSLLHFASGL